ncbi:hypothetical protein B0H13DRAFT_1904294 [Mycena leptocephala]|nr:hypothetical protein B0H13DRAFT_1904294 [Mycena leptocephala]
MTFDLTDAQFGLALRLHGKKVPRIEDRGCMDCLQAAFNFQNIFSNYFWAYLTFLPFLPTCFQRPESQARTGMVTLFSLDKFTARSNLYILKSGISGEPNNRIFCEYNRKRAGIRYPHIADELLARHVPDYVNGYTDRATFSRVTDGAARLYAAATSIGAKRGWAN